MEPYNVECGGQGRGQCTYSPLPSLFRIFFDFLSLCLWSLLLPFDFSDLFEEDCFWDCSEVSSLSDWEDCTESLDASAFYELVLENWGILGGGTGVIFLALSTAFTLSLDLDGVAVALVALEVERPTLGGGTGVLVICELDTACLIDFSLLLLDLAVLARLVICAGVAAGSFSELLSPLLLVSLSSSSAGCLRFRSPLAADFFPLANTAGATAGASAISSSESLLDEFESGLALILLAWGLLA